jgi:hypothetical protein
MQFSFENVNGARTLVSEEVHLDEIAVSWDSHRLGGAA